MGLALPLAAEEALVEGGASAAAAWRGRVRGRVVGQRGGAGAGADAVAGEGLPAYEALPQSLTEVLALAVMHSDASASLLMLQLGLPPAQWLAVAGELGDTARS